MKVKEITQDDYEYPKKLLQIKDKPTKLYALGNIDLLNKTSIAIVGSRDCTEYGYKQAIRFAKELSQKNICIVSGMAKGIDSAAHIGAKMNLGGTVAVLGGGFNDIFPKENESLFKEILEDGGCIISEYAPNIMHESIYFPRRNRIVAGLSDALLVVEAKHRSGTSITAKYAVKQKKIVYCIPSSLESKNAYGTSRLIQNGAKLVTSSNDILKDFGISMLKKAKETKKHITIDKKYKEIYEKISHIPISINELQKITNKNIVEINSAITMLELQGAIKQVGINEYIRNEE